MHKICINILDDHLTVRYDQYRAKKQRRSCTWCRNVFFFVHDFVGGRYGKDDEK